MGPECLRPGSGPRGQPSTLDDGRPEAFYLTRFHNLGEASQIHSRLRFEGGAVPECFPRVRTGTVLVVIQRGSGRAGAYQHGSVRRSAGTLRNFVDLDPVVKIRGRPALRFHYKFGDNEHRMTEDMKETAQEMFEAAGFKTVHVSSRILTETGRSMNSAPLAWAATRDVGSQSVRAPHDVRICSWWMEAHSSTPVARIRPGPLWLCVGAPATSRTNSAKETCKENQCPTRPNQSETGSPPVVEDFRLGAGRVPPAAAGVPSSWPGRSRAGAGKASQTRPPRVSSPRAAHAGRRLVGDYHPGRQPFRRRQGRQGCRLHRTVSRETSDDNEKSIWREGLRLIDLMTNTTTGNLSLIPVLMKSRC